MALNHYEFTLDVLPCRPIHHAQVLLGLAGSRRTVIALDHDRDEFVRVPDIQIGGDPELLCLSPDGAHLVLLTEHGGSRFGGLCLYTLANGQQRWLTPPDDYDWDRCAGFSPDGRHLATSGDRTRTDNWMVDVIDLDNGARRRVASAPGGWANESRVSWSPDGELIAMTYLALDDSHATIVFDLGGTVVGHFKDTVIMPSPNGTWLGDRELLSRNEDFELSAVNFAQGSSQPLGTMLETVVAVLDGRLVWSAGRRSGSPLVLTTSALDHSDMQPFITATPGRAMVFFDVARNL